MTMQISEVAAATGLSKATIRRAVANGQLLAWKTPGGHSRYWERDVVEFCTAFGIPCNITEARMFNVSSTSVR